jgi:hypothetical protein
MADLNNLITILWTVPIIGTNGTEKYFLTRHQYEISGVTTQLVPCSSECDETKVQMKPHYIVTIDSEDYYIDADNATFEGRLREDWETDWNIYKEKKPFEQPKNYNEVYKQVYGVDRVLASQRQDNGYAIWKELGFENIQQ